MMSEKKRFFESMYEVFDREKGRKLQAYEIIDLLNELHEETQLLKCALALDEVTNISLNDKKVDIPPYYEFENYQQLKKERREEYDEYW